MTVSPDTELIPALSEIIEVHVAQGHQLFDAIDPSPLGQRDLDSRVETFILESAREAHRDRGLALLVHLDDPAERDVAGLGEAVRGFFELRARSAHYRLRQLLKRGRLSLAVGLLFMVASITAGGLVESALAFDPLGIVLRESLLIGGWVALWRPLELFFYDWWPIRAEARLLGRLSRMPVRITAPSAQSSNAPAGMSGALRQGALAVVN
jgi:hypothetical protein